MRDKPRTWICCRQRAGPLVKECRAVRPRLSKTDSPFERAEKNKVLRPPRESAVCRTRVDRLELLLALFGFEGWSYVLTFDDDHLPDSYAGVRKRWRLLLARMKAYHGSVPDYVYLIEGKHGAHRYHLHLTVRYCDFPPLVMETLWRDGYVESGQPLLLGGWDSYRRTAKYYCKERSDGITIPIDARTWVASRSLTRKLPEVERFESDTGKIDIPDDYRTCGRYTVDNAFGHYQYGWYIEQDPRHPTVVDGKRLPCRGGGRVGS